MLHGDSCKRHDTDVVWRRPEVKLAFAISRQKTFIKVSSRSNVYVIESASVIDTRAVMLLLLYSWNILGSDLWYLSNSIFKLLFKAVLTIVERHYNVLRLSLPFLHLDSNLPDDQETPCQKYTRGSIVGQTRNIHSNFSPIPPLNFTGGQKVPNVASIFDTSRLWRTVASKQRNLSET